METQDKIRATREMEIGNKSETVTVDERDFEDLNQFKWDEYKNNRGTVNIRARIEVEKLKELGIDADRSISVSLPSVVYFKHIKGGTIVKGITESRNRKVAQWDGNLHNASFNNLGLHGDVRRHQNAVKVTKMKSESKSPMDAMMDVGKNVARAFYGGASIEEYPKPDDPNSDGPAMDIEELATRILIEDLTNQAEKIKSELGKLHQEIELKNAQLDIMHRTIENAKIRLESFK